MAATTITDYNIYSPVLEGYVQAYIPERFRLLSSGILVGDPVAAARLSAAGGNMYIARGDERFNAADQEIDADTDVTLRPWDTYKEQFPIIRRAQGIASEDIAALAAGDVDAQRNMAVPKIGAKLVYNYQLNTEKRIIQKILAAQFADGGCLVGTHFDSFSEPLAHWMFRRAEKRYGDQDIGAGAVLIHPDVLAGMEERALKDPNLKGFITTQYNADGSVAGTRIGGNLVIKNKRITEVSDGVYNTYVLYDGAINYTFQMAPRVEFDRDIAKAAGTNFGVMSYAQALGVYGTTWNTTAPTDITGATDTEIGTASNWAKRTSKDSVVVPSEYIRVVCIQTPVE